MPCWVLLPCIYIQPHCLPSGLVLPCIGFRSHHMPRCKLLLKRERGPLPCSLLLSYRLLHSDTLSCGLVLRSSRLYICPMPWRQLVRERSLQHLSQRLVLRCWCIGPESMSARVILSHWSLCSNDLFSRILLREWGFHFMSSTVLLPSEYLKPSPLSKRLGVRSRLI
jgi:hypothetical protein